MWKALVVCSLFYCYGVSIKLGKTKKVKTKIKDGQKCKPKNLLERKYENVECFEDKFKLLYLETNFLIVKSTPKQAGIVERALNLSKRENLTDIQLKVLTDVIHYQITRRPLLTSSRPMAGVNTSTNENDVVHLGSDILREQNIPALQDLSEVYPIGERLLRDFETFSHQTMESLINNTYISNAENIAFQATPCNGVPEESAAGGYVFYGDSAAGSQIKDVIVFPNRNLPSNDSRCAVSAMYFKTLQKLLPSSDSVFPQPNTTNTTRFVNSRVISLSVLGTSGDHLKSPVKVTLEHLKKQRSLEMNGVFWNFSQNESYGGHWSDAGCKTVHQNGSTTTFECTHLTNFAVLVTGRLETKEMTKSEYLALSVTSSVGCFFSMIGEIVTLVIYAITKARSKRRFILMNIVLCLVLAQAIFLAGIEQGRKNKALCAFIAASISYFFLASFCWMLNMAIHLYLIISFLVPRNFPFWYFMLAGYVFPLIEILLAAAISQGNGFGTKDFCWFSYDSGAVWIFLTPVSFIITVNIVIAIMVLAKMLKTKHLQDKKTVEKVKHILRAIVILTPSLGLTWIFSFFTMATESVAMQFIFAILCSFQGILIFISCCVLDKKVREEFLGVLRHPKRLSSRASLRQISQLPEAIGD